MMMWGWMTPCFLHHFLRRAFTRSGASGTFSPSSVTSLVASRPRMRLRLVGSGWVLALTVTRVLWRRRMSWRSISSAGWARMGC